MASFLDEAEETLENKIAHMEKPTANLSDVNVKDVTRESVGLKSDVLIHNPYDHDLPVLEISYRLRTGDKEITSGSLTDTGAIAPNGDTSVQVGSDVGYGFLMEIINEIESDWDIDYDFDVGVTLKLPFIHSFTIPLHKKGTIKLPTLSEIL